MRVVHIISLIARQAFMVTLVLGLVFWIAHLPFLSGLLAILAQIDVTSIHEGFGIIGVLGLLMLGSRAVFTKGSRLLGVGSMVYALLVPTFGVTQVLILGNNLHWVIQVAHLLIGIGAMYLARGVEKRFLRFKLEEIRGHSPEASTIQAVQ